MSIIPSVAIDTVNIENIIGKSSDDDIDWWPMFHHDLQHSGNSTSKAPDTNNVLWVYKTAYEESSSPVVADGKVYIGSDDNKVYCLDANNGDYIWTTKTRDNVVSSPAVADGKVYIGSGDNKVYCLNANTGEYIWSYTTGYNVLSSPAVVDGKVYIGSLDGNVYCLDANTGDYIWSYKAGYSVYSSPAIADGKVYIGSTDRKVYCLDANTGDYIWSYTTGDFVDSSPAVADGKVYISSNDGYVYAFEKFDSNAPSAPEIDGPSKGEPYRDLCFTFHSTDPDGDDVRYIINWGDHYSSMTDFYPSGTDVMVEHMWREEGIYNITAKAKDIHGYEGPEVTVTLNVTIIPRVRVEYHLLFLWFLERFPFLEVFLRAMNLLR